MAGDWIKMRLDLADDPSVLALARELRIDPDAAVGVLHRFWSWASRNTKDGRLRDVTVDMIDAITRRPGFTRALQAVGWLAQSPRGFSIPKFDRHMSWSAKARCGEALRKVRQRSRLGAGTCPDMCPDKNGTRARAAPSRKEEREHSSSSGTSLRLAEPPSLMTSALGARQREVARMLGTCVVNGRHLFDPRTAAAVAAHPRATREQVAWAIERTQKAQRASRVKNAAGYLRSLIESETPPAEWVQEYRRRQLSEIVGCEQQRQRLRNVIGAGAGVEETQQSGQCDPADQGGAVRSVAS